MEIDYSFLSYIERRLFEGGWGGLDLVGKNELIVFVANKQGKMYSEINEQTLLDYHKQMKIQIFGDLCDDLIMEGFLSQNGHTYRTNKDDQSNFIGKAAELALLPDVDVIFWKTEDVGYISHTRQEFIEVFQEGVSHKQSLLYKFDMLKQQVLSAQTDAEVFAVKWDSEEEPTEENE